MTTLTSHATRRLLLDFHAMRQAEQDAVAALHRVQEQRALFIESINQVRWLRGRRLRRVVRGVP